jgi:hypothetical protein
MRKIQTEEEKRKKEKKNQIIVGTILVFLLVVSTLGYSLMSQDNDSSNSGKVTDKGLDFYTNGDYFQLIVGEQTFTFENLPSEVEYLTQNISIDFNNFLSKPLYIVNPTDQTGPVLSNIRPYLLRYQEACLTGMNCSEELPKKTCSENVLIFNSTEEENIKVNENCIYINGNNNKISDAFTYKFLGIN